MTAGEQEVRAILLTADAAAGEALAYSCTRRGLQVTLADPGRTGSLDADVVLVDLRSSGAARLPILSALSHARRRLIALTAAPGAVVGQDFDTWVSLDCSIDELCAAIRGTTKNRVQPPLATDGRSGLELLTPREREVMTLLLAGMRVEAIGAQLRIAASTVRTHLQNILAKLGMSSREEAAAWALNAGLAPAEIEGRGGR
jgi:DNA-binding NarL/FixJ family response regulator